MSTNATVNKLMGVCDDLIGGSSLMWRYHHQVGGGVVDGCAGCGS
jgi:fatty acid desaturase (delta-4 desaturase)